MKYKNKITNEEVVANTYVENYVYSNNSNYELIEEESETQKEENTNTPVAETQEVQNETNESIDTNEEKATNELIEEDSKKESKSFKKGKKDEDNK